MFAKQAQIAVAAIALTIAGGAFAGERNVFDTETDLRIPVSASAESSRKPVTVAKTVSASREAVRAELAAARASGEMNVFDTETNLRVAPSAARQASTAVAQR